MAKRTSLIKHARQLAQAPNSGHIQGNNNTTHHNGVDTYTMNQLIKIQKDQIKFLQTALTQSYDRNKVIADELALSKKTVEITLVNLVKTCEDCYAQHKSAHNKLDKLAAKLK